MDDSPPRSVAAEDGRERPRASKHVAKRPVGKVLWQQQTFQFLNSLMPSSTLPAVAVR